MSAIAFVQKYKWAIVLVVVAAFLFYWYEIRPVRAYRGCAAQASADARTLLRQKADIAKGTDKGNAYDALIQKNMYLRSDYNSFLDKCLLYYGLQVPPSMQDNTTSAGSSSSEQL